MSSKNRKRATREDILDSAWDLVAARGADVSMAAIAAAAGVSRQAVYLHFGTRGGLLTALVLRADERFEIRAAFDRASRKRSAAARLDGYLISWFEFAARILPVARDLIRLRATDADAALAWEDRMAELRTWLAELVASIAADDALSPEWNVREAADYLWISCSVQVWDLFVSDCGWTNRRVSTVLRRSIAKVLLK